MKGDWEAANAFLNEHPNCVQLPITMEKATVLHSAAAAKHANFVEEVLKWMTPGDLELKTIDGDTALHVAAQTGEVKIAKEMVEINNELPLIHNYKGMIPLHAAAYKRDRKMVDYLFSDCVTPFQRLTTRQRIKLLLLIVSAGFYGMPLANIYMFLENSTEFLSIVVTFIIILLNLKNFQFCVFNSDIYIYIYIFLISSIG